MSAPIYRRRPGFTLLELLVVIMLIGILASFVLVALAGATQTAKQDRTKAQIKKIHELIMEQWEQYQYRRVPPTKNMLLAQRGTAISSKQLSNDRLQSLREVMRMEMPSFQWDILGDESRNDNNRKQKTLDNLGRKYVPPVTRAYLRRIAEAEENSGTKWQESGQFQDAECLYLILSQIRSGDASSLSFFSENEIGDVDGDGMKEILDGWGNPIRWTLWAPGYISPLQPAFSQNQQQEDVLDISQAGSGYVDANTNGIPDRFEGEFVDLPRALYPLIYSGGPDGVIGTLPWTTEEGKTKRVKQNWAAVGSDPYNRVSKYEMYRIGAPNAAFADAMADDISNHYLTTR